MNKTDVKEIYALSPMQEGMLFHNIMDETSSAYFEQMALVVSGKIERDLLENTMNGIIEKYDILRTVFTYKKTKKPRQVLLKKRKINVPFEDISTLNEEGQTEFIEGFKKADRQKGFALSKGPLIRVSLLKCREDSYRLIWSYHHILMDGWCFGILFKDFMEIYTRLEKKQKENKYTPQKETLPKIPGILPAAPYSRFIKWLERQNKQKAMGFWEKYLDGYDQQVSIPRPEKENRDEDYREGKLESVITERLARELKKLALEKHATVGTFFQTLWGILLQKYNNTVDAVFGVVVSGRPPEIPGIDEMVGLFINTVPVRVNAAKYGTFSSLLTAVQRHAVESKTYDYLPLPEIQAHSFLKSGLVDHILAFENVPLQNNIRETAGNGAAAFAITGMNAYEQTDYGFNVIAAPAGDTLCIRLLYNAMKYDPGFIENITGHLQEIIKQVVANPDIDVQHITIITETEKRLLLRDFNRTNRKYPKEKTIHEIFAGQVGKTPDNAAVVARSIWENPRPGPWENTGKDTGKNTGKNTGNPAAKAAHLLTYKALEQKSDHLAARLKDKGLLPGQIVGILVEHSLEMITGILAVLKAGGAFLPIDPVYPRARIDFMLKDSGANLLLTSTTLAHKIQRSTEVTAATAATEAALKQDVRTYFLDTGAFSRAPEASPVTHSKPRAPGETHRQPETSAPAYVIYTSGSTGKPKGVLVEHRALVNLCTWHNDYYTVTSADRAAKYAGSGFDASVWELFPYLAAGASIYIVPDGLKLEMEGLNACFETNGITVAFLPAQVCQLFMKMANSSLRLLLTGGDKLNRFEKRGYRLVNNYGPTENTVVTTAFPVDRQYVDIPIGRPLYNSRVYVLGRNRELQPLYVPGELYISGANLARGYLNRPGLTAQKFILNPYAATPDATSPDAPVQPFSPETPNSEERHFAAHSRLYRTGDRVRRLPDGNLEFMGRVDTQVKIRGFRIELGEIEARILAHEAVKDAAVIDRRDPDGNNSLCAFIVPAGDDMPEIPGLKEYLAEDLPPYMIPVFFMRIDEIPLTPNGKTDRSALPQPDKESTAAAPYEAPGDDVETGLQEIWQDILTQEPIGIHDNFFALGGHSLKASILVGRINRTFQVSFPLSQVFKSATIETMAHYIKECDKKNRDQIPQAAVRESYPLSAAQKRLFTLAQLGPGTDTAETVYNIPLVVKVKGRWDTRRMESVLNRLIQRHESLRTSFKITGGEPEQDIHPHAALTVEYFHAGPIAAEGEKSPEVDPLIEDFIRPFDLSRAPLLRAGMITGENETSIFMMDMHHIISDGTSMTILIREFGELYADAPLPPLRIQYKDYAMWQTEQYQTGVMKARETFWRQEFAGDIPVLDMPCDYPRPPLQSFDGHRVTTRLDRQVTGRIKTLTASKNATLFMVLSALFNILLARYAGQEDIIVGSVISGRTHADLEHIVGMFVNTLALRNYPRGENTFALFLEEVKERALKAFENQDYPFDRLVETLDIRRDLSRNPLFDVMFDLQNTAAADIAEKMAGLTVTPYARDNPTAKFDLTLTAVEMETEIGLTWEYCTKLFKEETIRRMANHFATIVTRVTGNPETGIAHIDMLSPAEKRQLTVEFNETQTGYPEAKTIHQLFEEQAEREPDSDAVFMPAAGSATGPALTYGELNREADNVAGLLKEKGVGPGIIAAVMVEPSPAMIVAILGILKAGGAYLPVSAAFPQQRIRYILADSNAKVLLTVSTATAPAVSGDTEIVFTEDAAPATRTSTGPAAVTASRATHQASAATRHDSSDPAYVIYTSGTTGNPKGVLVRHFSVINRLYWVKRKYALNRDDVVLQKTPVTFDVSVCELFRWILPGARLCILPAGWEKEPQKIIGVIGKYKITTADFVPSMLRVFLEFVDKEAVTALRSLRWVFIGAETVDPELVAAFNKTFSSRGGAIPGGTVSNRVTPRLINAYGPTEATVDVTWFDCSAEEAPAVIPIGKPMDNVWFAILSKNRRIQPVGVPGELCIGGDSLAAGYLNKPELTAERFTHYTPPDLNGSRDLSGTCGAAGEKITAEENKNAPGAEHNPRKIPMKKLMKTRIYHTGDLARWLPDGNIEFLGRIDTQVKIRGFRIELEEIENRLLKIEHITSAAVLAKENAGEKYLCAYVVSNKKNPESFLREQLARHLPEYMVPAAYVFMETLPLTVSGKVDRNALPEPGTGSSAAAGGVYEAPRDDVEKELAEIWQDILKVKQVGRGDHFFHRGGHSLKAVLLSAKVHRALNVRVPLQAIFRHALLREMAQYIKNAGKAVYASIEPAEKAEYYPVSSAQKRLYALNRFESTGPGTAYNIPTCLKVEGPLDTERLETVFHTLIQRHESFRTTFEMRDGEPVQAIHPRVDFNIERKALPAREPGRAGTNRPEALSATASVTNEFVRPFDLAQAPLLRVGLAAMDAENHILMVDMHHIISDGVSMQVLTSEFIALYAGALLSPMRIQYKDYALWQWKLSRSGIIEKQEAYWLEEFAGEIPLLELPYDYQRPARQSFEGGTAGFALDMEMTARLKSVAQKEGATTYMVLLALYNVFLGRCSGQEDIIVGSPTAGRPHTDLQPVIGMFVNTLVQRNYPKKGKTFKAFLGKTRERALQAFDNQDYQFEELVEKLELRRDLSRNPLFDTLFSLREMESVPRENEKQDTAAELRFSPYGYESGISKFDLSLAAVEGEELQFTWTYSRALFKKETVEGFSKHFLLILRQVVDNPRIALGAIELVTEEEKEQLLVHFNGTRSFYPADKSIIRLFEEQVEKTPGKIAAAGYLESPEEKDGHLPAVIAVTYSELNEEAVGLARQLRSSGVRRGHIVALQAARTPAVAVAIMAILKAGAAFLPIDLESPEERTAYMLKDSNAAALLKSAPLRLDTPGYSPHFKEESPVQTGGLCDGMQLYHPGPGKNAVDTGGFHPQNASSADAGTEAPRIPTTSSDALYVIYTSGTTGQPKGVMIRNGNLVNYVSWFSSSAGLTMADRGLLTSSFAFDLGYTSIFPTLLKGGQLHIVPKEMSLSPQSLLRYIADNGITYLKLTPSLFGTIVDAPGFPGGIGETLRLVLLGGEEINITDVEKIHALCPHLEIMNHYGPTEATIGCVARYIDFRRVEEYRRIPTIGRPIANTHVFILDPEGKLVPVGFSGELCVGGHGVANGYLNRPELSSEKFIPADPSWFMNLDESPGENSASAYNGAHNGAHNCAYNGNNAADMHRVYRTGDLAKWLPDGNIQFLGRIDHQVKIRGFRIELGEIENRLIACDFIKEAVVTATAAPAAEGEKGDPAICAYVVAHREGSGFVPAIREYLAGKLPGYMMPAYIVPMEKIPLTPNGKVDLRALPRPGVHRVKGDEPGKAAARDEVESVLVALWQDILKIPVLGIHDNFFELGGDSIKAIRILSLLQMDFDIALNDIFQHQTIAGLAGKISYKKDILKSKIEALKRQVAAVPQENGDQGDGSEKIRAEITAYRKKTDTYSQRVPGTPLTYRAILLTGATGYLGIHLLLELLKTTTSDIYVLVRGESVQDAKERLTAKMNWYFREDLFERFGTRIFVIHGDITRERFNLARETYEKLSQTIDCIINSAAHVKHFGTYEAFQRINVEGVTQLIEFALTGSKKDFNHISTTSVSAGDIEDRETALFTEFDCDIGQSSENVYIKSKLEAEKLVTAARAQGVAARIFRVGNLVFHSLTGRFQENIGDNAFYSQLKAFIRTGVVPDIGTGIFDFAYIDHTARAVSLLFADSALENETFHLRNRHTVAFDQLGRLFKGAGVPLEILSPADYLDYLYSNYDNEELRPYIADILLHFNILEGREGTDVTVLSEKTHVILETLGFYWPPLKGSHIEEMLAHCKSVGFL